MNIQDDIKVLEKNKDYINVAILDNQGDKVGSFELEGSGDGKIYTIIGADIDPKFRGKGLYKDSILQLIKQTPNLTIVSAFRSAEAERAWISLIKKLPSNYTVKKERQDGEVVYYLSKS